MEYRHPGSPSVKKFKTVSSAKKLMLTIFLDTRVCFTRNFWLKGRRWIPIGIVQSYVHSSKASAESGQKETHFFCITTTKGHIAVHKLRTLWQAWNSQWFYIFLTTQIWHRQILVVPKIEGDVKRLTFFIVVILSSVQTASTLSTITVVVALKYLTVSPFALSSYSEDTYMYSTWWDTWHGLRWKTQKHYPANCNKLKKNNDNDVKGAEKLRPNRDIECWQLTYLLT